MPFRGIDSIGGVRLSLEQIWTHQSRSALEAGLSLRVSWGFVLVVAAAVGAVSYLPILQSHFQLRHPWIVIGTAVVAGSVSTLGLWRLRRGDPRSPWVLSLVDTLLYGLTPILVVLWSQPVGGAIALAVHGIMAFHYGRVAKNWFFMAVVVAPPLLALPVMLETPLLLLEGGLFLSLFVTITWTDTKTLQAEEERRHAETMAMVAEAVHGAHQAAEAAAYAEAKLHVHEIRNMLTGPSLFASLLEESESELDEDDQEHIQAIMQGLRETSAYLVGTMERLSDASKVSTCTLEEVLQRMKQRLAKSLKSLKPVVRGDTAGIDIPGKPNVIADCLVNLVRNAQEAGAKNVAIDLFEKKKEITLRVSDDGPGIAPEIEGKLFQPGVTHGKSSGSGYALHIMVVILGTLGGSVELVHPQPEKGAAFELKLPIVDRTLLGETRIREQSSEDDDNADS